LHNITIRGYSVVELWCQSNKAFLVLPPRTSNDTNYSESDGARSFFCAVRLDPPTLLVDVGDLTFANPMLNIPFASAYECRSPIARSKFNVDLTGSAFRLANATAIFAYGWELQNASTISVSLKTANGSVGGVCSGTYTGPHRIIVGSQTANPPAGMANETFCYNLQWCLQLALDMPIVEGAVPAAPCALPSNLTGTLRCSATLRDSPPPLASSICPALPSNVTMLQTTAALATTASASTTSTTTATAVSNATVANSMLSQTAASAGSPSAMATAAYDGSSEADTDVVAIVWGVIGAVLIVTLIVGLAFVFVWRRNRHDSRPPPALADDDALHSAGDLDVPLPLTIEAIPSDPMTVVAVSGRTLPHCAAGDDGAAASMPVSTAGCRETLFKCTSPNCNKSYLRASDLHAHIQRRHPVEPRNSASATSGTSARERQYITSIARHVVAPASGARQYDVLSRDEIGESNRNYGSKQHK
jgi:hypothetical protein